MKLWTNLRKRYKAPTPATWWWIGTLCLGINATIAGIQFLANDKMFAVIMAVCGVLGQQLTKLAVKKGYVDEPN